MIKLFNYISLTALLLSVGCTYELEQVDRPTNLIPRDSFTVILKDVMILEAYVKTQKNNVHDFYKILPASVDSIFEVHGVDSSRYISSMEYYSKKQEVLKDIYKDIQDDVILESAELQSEQQSD